MVDDDVDLADDQNDSDDDSQVLPQEFKEKQKQILEK